MKRAPIISERLSLTAGVVAAMKQVSALGDRALKLDGNEAYYALNAAWHKLDEAERLLAGKRPRKRGRRAAHHKDTYHGKTEAGGVEGRGTSGEAP